MVDLYLEFEDYKCYVNEKILVIETDSRAASSSTNSVVSGAMSPSCWRAATRSLGSFWETQRQLSTPCCLEASQAANR